MPRQAMKIAPELTFISIWKDINSINYPAHQHGVLAYAGDTSSQVFYSLSAGTEYLQLESWA